MSVCHSYRECSGDGGGGGGDDDDDDDDCGFSFAFSEVTRVVLVLFGSGTTGGCGGDSLFHVLL